MSGRRGRLLSGVLNVALAVIIVIGVSLGDGGSDDRVNSLGTRIRCPVCVGESIAESPAETAQGMMSIVAERVAAGDSDEEIIAFFQSRYGPEILLDPPFRGLTLVLWLLPGVAVVLGVALAAQRVRRPLGG